MDTATTDIYTYSQTLSLRVVLPIYRQLRRVDGDVERAAGAAHVGCAELVIFERLEMRLQVRPAPAVAIPLVIVARLAADIDHAIQRTRSAGRLRSEEHTSELQSLMRISYAVFCLKQNTIHNKS